MSYLSYAYVTNTIQRTHMQFIRIITTGQEWTRMDRVNTKTKQKQIEGSRDEAEENKSITTTQTNTLQGTDR